MDGGLQRQGGAGGAGRRVLRVRRGLLCALCALWVVPMGWGCGAVTVRVQALPPSAEGLEEAPADVDPAWLEGRASWYGDRFHGRTTASGEVYDMRAFTAAHRDLPFGTVVRVVRVDTLQSVVVRINDRGPFVAGRVIDLSRVAAEDIDLIRPGTAPVTLEILGWGEGRR